MNTFGYTVSTEKPFDEAVRANEKKLGEKGIGVRHKHDVGATLAENGYRREPLEIIEFRNTKYRNTVLSKHVKILLMLRCSIGAYRRRKQVSQHITSDYGSNLATTRNPR
jgi:uncharacterized protein (DUF302 family)